MENTVNTQGIESTANQQEKTFTQSELNSIIETRLAREKEKYADYESLVEKAKKFDEAEEAQKTELQRMTEKADALEKKLSHLETENKTREIRASVAKETGVPVELLTESDKEACEAQAKAILSFAGSQKKAYPSTQRNVGAKSDLTPQQVAMADLARQVFKRE